jgi:hypothetical protein
LIGLLASDLIDSQLVPSEAPKCENALLYDEEYLSLEDSPEAREGDF